MRRIVGFTGRMGAGKDTAALELTSSNYENTKFAAALKNMMRELYRAAGVDDDTIEQKIEGDLKETPCEILGGKTPRYAMQTLGTEWGRDTISPSLWVDIWKNKVTSLRNSDIVVTDVRYPNEADAVRDMGGLLVHIQRGEQPMPSHQSEIMDFIADFTIVNDGTIDELREKVRALKELPRDIRQSLDRDAA